MWSGASRPVVPVRAGELPGGLAEFDGDPNGVFSVRQPTGGHELSKAVLVALKEMAELRLTLAAKTQDFAATVQLLVDTATDAHREVGRMERAVDALEREVRYLRQYGNKDCTAMADDAMERNELEDDSNG